MYLVKECSDCGETKFLSEFSPKPRGLGRVDSFCYPCRAKYRRERRKNPEISKGETRSSQKWYVKNPEKYRAKIAVRTAIRHGELEKLPCEVCGTEDGQISGHHADYSKPLEVQWLCALHHKAEHARLRAEG